MHSLNINSPWIQYLAVSFAFTSLTGCKSESKEAPQQVAPETVRVQVQRIETLPAAQAITYSGAVEARTTTPLSFPMPGTVRRVLVEAGQHVSKGQLLAEVDPGSIGDNYQMALARQQQAQDMYNRLKPVVEAGSLPAVRLVEAKSALAQANAGLRSAGSNVRDTRLTAPANGVIGARSLEPGQTAAPGMPVLQLLDISSVYVRVAVPESEIANVRTGQSAQVLVAAVGGQPLVGKVEEVGVVADPSARTYPVKIALPNASQARKLMPGMVSSVSLQRQDGQTGVVVPNQTVTVDEQGRNYVYVADGQKAVLRRIKTGALQQRGILVLDGLAPQDRLITSGFQRLSDGAAISVVQ